MGKFQLCFIFDESGDYKPVPYSKLMDGGERRPEYANRYFIPISGYLLEVSKEDYHDHYKAVNRKTYIRREAKRVGEVSLETVPTSELEGARELYADIVEQVIADMMVLSLHKAIDMLEDDDRLLIRMLYFEDQTERQCAEVFGVYRNAIHIRKKRILEKLREILAG